jgi:hypothetical protein
MVVSRRFILRGTKMVDRVKFKKAEIAKSDYVLKPKEQAAIQKPASGLAKNTTPGLKIVNGRVEIDHPDALMGVLLMMAAFATSDPAFMQGILRQIGAACIFGERPATSQNDLNFVLSIIKGNKPRNENETMLATHIALTHLIAMNANRRLETATSTEEIELAERIYNKSTKSLLSLVEGIKRLQSSGEPIATVQTVQNVSVNAGGQAIVGHVTQDSPSTAAKIAPSPPALTRAPMDAMPIIEIRAPEVVPFKPRRKK